MLQAVPHAPQLVVVLSGASQPLLTSVSQLPHPALHAIEHVLSVHDGTPLVLLQALPHVPQLPTFVCVLTSQPLASVASQLP